MVDDIEEYVKAPGYFKKEDFQERIQAKLRSFEGQLIKKMRSDFFGILQGFQDQNLQKARAIS